MHITLLMLYISESYTMETQYQCNLCEKAFTKNSNLTQHMRIHTEELPYQCTYCNLRFSKNSNLKRHMNIHTEVKPYHCNVCYKDFSTNFYFAQHITKDSYWGNTISMYTLWLNFHTEIESYNTYEYPYWEEAISLQFVWQGFF